MYFYLLYYLFIFNINIKSLLISNLRISQMLTNANTNEKRAVRRSSLNYLLSTIERKMFKYANTVMCL